MLKLGVTLKGNLMLVQGLLSVQASMLRTLMYFNVHMSNLYHAPRKFIEGTKMCENAFSGSINSHKESKEYPLFTVSVFSQALSLNAEFKMCLCSTFYAER